MNRRGFFGRLVAFAVGAGAATEAAKATPLPPQSPFPKLLRPTPRLSPGDWYDTRPYLTGVTVNLPAGLLYFGRDGLPLGVTTPDGRVMTTGVCCVSITRT